MTETAEPCCSSHLAWLCDDEGPCCPRCPSDPDVPATIVIMSEQPAPAPAGDLRERLAKAATEWALMYPLANWPWPGRSLSGDAAERLDAIARNIAVAWGTDIADRVLAVLLEDPGNLPQRLVDAILDLPSTVLTDERHRDHQYAIGCPVCKGDVPAMVQAVMGVRDELMVHLAARLADAERRAEHAEGEHQVTRERLNQARRERDLAVAHDRQPYPTAWAYEQACKALEDHRQRADHAEATEQRVRALHYVRGRNIHGDDVCAECSPLRPYPCPTIRALDGGE